MDEVTVTAPGINGKMSEFNAALGLLQLKHMGAALARRKEIDAKYRELLKDTKGLRCVGGVGEAQANYAYFPILLDDDYPISRDALYQKMSDNNIHARRYFFPLISSFPMYRGLPSARPDNLPIASTAALQVLCLPIYPAMETPTIVAIAQLIAEQK